MLVLQTGGLPGRLAQLSLPCWVGQEGLVVVTAIQTNRHSATLGRCPRCVNGTLVESDNEVLCFQCGHRRYQKITSQMKFDAARLLPSPEELAVMVADSKWRVHVKACKQCGVEMSNSGVYLCEKCRANNRITFDCPICGTPRTMLMSKYEQQARRNKGGQVFCSQSCANIRTHKKNQKTFLCAYCRKPKTMALGSYRDQKARLKKAAGLCCSRDCSRNLQIT